MAKTPSFLDPNYFGDDPQDQIYVRPNAATRAALDRPLDVSVTRRLWQQGRGKPRNLNARVQRGPSITAPEPNKFEDIYNSIGQLASRIMPTGGDTRTTYQRGADYGQNIASALNWAPVSPHGLERAFLHGIQQLSGDRPQGVDTEDYINLFAPGAGYAIGAAAPLVARGAARVSRDYLDDMFSRGAGYLRHTDEMPVDPDYVEGIFSVRPPADLAVPRLTGPAPDVADLAVPRLPPLAVKPYADPPSSSIADWQWRPFEDVQADLGDLSAISPEATEFGRFMQEKNLQAQSGIDPRDLLKAYGITRSSIQRQARSLAKSQEGGLDLGHLGLDMVRPEGAFSEWLGTDAGQAYLDAAQRGQVRPDALDDLKVKFRPFGFQNTLADNLAWAAENLPQEAPRVSDLIIAAPGDANSIADYRAFIRDKVYGVAAPKAGFVGSLLGRGDLPTLDAREIVLNTGRPTEEATSYLSRRKNLGGVEGVDRLASRLAALKLAIPDDLAPYYQHLAHHSVWDKASNEATTHADLMNAMRNYRDGGSVRRR